jgi:hypothetical protein
MFASVASRCPRPYQRILCQLSCARRISCSHLPTTYTGTVGNRIVFDWIDALRCYA